MGSPADTPVCITRGEKPRPGWGNGAMAVHDWIAPVVLERPSRSRAHFLSTIDKYFLFVRTGIGVLQIDPGDFNRARPMCPMCLL